MTNPYSEGGLHAVGPSVFILRAGRWSSLAAQNIAADRWILCPCKGTVQCAIAQVEVEHPLQSYTHP